MNVCEEHKAESEARRSKIPERAARRSSITSAKRDDQIARPRRAQTCARSARWECAREAGRFFFKVWIEKYSQDENWILRGLECTLHRKFARYKVAWSYLYVLWVPSPQFAVFLQILPITDILYLLSWDLLFVESLFLSSLKHLKSFVKCDDAYCVIQSYISKKRLLNISLGVRQTITFTCSLALCCLYTYSRPVLYFIRWEVTPINTPERCPFSCCASGWVFIWQKFHSPKK